MPDSPENKEASAERTLLIGGLLLVTESPALLLNGVMVCDLIFNGRLPAPEILEPSLYSDLLAAVGYLLYRRLRA